MSDTDALIERPEAVIAAALDLGLQAWRTVPDAAQKFREAAAALAALRDRPACEFGCGRGDDSQAGDGFGIVPACPVHGWVCELLDARDARAQAAEAALAQADKNLAAAEPYLVTTPDGAMNANARSFVLGCVRRARAALGEAT